MNGKQARLLLHYYISQLCYIGKPAYISMPRFLTGCHYNKNISWHFKQNIEYYPVQMNGNKFATGEILRKLVEVWEGTGFSWLSSKVFLNPATDEALCGNAVSKVILAGRSGVPESLPG